MRNQPAMTTHVIDAAPVFAHTRELAIQHKEIVHAGKLQPVLVSVRPNIAHMQIAEDHMLRRFRIFKLPAIVAVQSVPLGAGDLDMFNHQIPHARNVNSGDAGEDGPRFAGQTAKPNRRFLCSGKIRDIGGRAIFTGEEAYRIARFYSLQRAIDRSKRRLSRSIAIGIIARGRNKNLPQRFLSIRKGDDGFARFRACARQQGEGQQQERLQTKIHW